jgi:hypothetical protein
MGEGGVVEVTSGHATRLAGELDDGGDPAFLVPSGSFRAAVRAVVDGRSERFRGRAFAPSVLVLDPGAWVVYLDATAERRYGLVLYGRLEALASD